MAPPKHAHSFALHAHFEWPTIFRVTRPARLRAQSRYTLLHTFHPRPWSLVVGALIAHEIPLIWSLNRKRYIRMEPQTKADPSGRRTFALRLARNAIQQLWFDPLDAIYTNILGKYIYCLTPTIRDMFVCAYSSNKWSVNCRNIMMGVGFDWRVWFEVAEFEVVV